MFIQGDLQAVFNALYSIGAIDPVLRMDWEKINLDMNKNPLLVKQACSQVNACRGNQTLLVQTLNSFEPKLLNFVALEVAREFSEFQDRKELH
ncbi:MAG: cytochrome [Bdellovibrionaceae bacterium]|nr:cytochrome [Bdellovibrio sp.]